MNNIDKKQKPEIELLQQSEISYRGLFNSVSEAIYILDADGVFVDVNEGAARMYGYPREFFIGKTPLDISAPGMNDPALTQQQLKAAFGGEAQSFEFWGARSNGEVFPKQVHLSKGMFFGKDAIIALASDISERKRAETIQQRQMKELSVLHTAALAGAQAFSEDELITRITHIVGNSLYPDNFGVFLVDETSKTLSAHPSYRGTVNSVGSEITHISKGITGLVAASGSPLRIADTSTEESYIEINPSTRSELCVPIRIGKRVIGVINAESKEKDFFTENDERLLNTIAGHMATSLDQIRLFESEKQRRQEAETLRETALAITSSLNLDEAIQRILEQLSRVLPYDSACVQILEDGYVENLAGHGWPHEEIMGMRFPIPGDNPNTIVIEERRVVILDNAAEQHAPFRVHPHNYINSWMGVPLIIRDKVLGMLAVDSKKMNYFTEESAKLAEAFAHQAAIAIENATLFNREQARRQEAETLRQAAHTISSSLDLKEVLQTILSSLKRAIPHNSAAVILLDGDELVLTDGHGFPNMETAIGARFPTSDSLFRKIQSSAHPFILPNAQKSPDFMGWAETSDIRGWMGIPLIVRGKVIGFITLDSIEENAYNENQAELAQTFAQQAAAAIDNARLYEAEKKRRQEAEALREAAITINSNLSLDIVLETVAQQITTALDAADCAISAWKYQEDFITTLVDYNQSRPEYVAKAGKRYYLNKYPTIQRVLKNQEIIIINHDDSHIERATLALLKKQGFTTLLMAPMVVGEHSIGLIEIYKEEQGGARFTQEDIHLIRGLAAHAAIAIENARHYQNALISTERRTILHRVSQDMVRVNQSPEQIYQAIYEAARELMPCDAFVLSLRFENQKDDQAVYLVDQGKRYPSTSVTKESSIISLVEKSHSHIVHDIATAELGHVTTRFGSSIKVRSMLVSPLQVDGKVLGAISTQSYEANAYGEEERLLLEMLATHAVTAIENARLYQTALDDIDRRGILHSVSQAMTVQMQDPEKRECQEVCVNGI